MGSQYLWQKIPTKMNSELWVQKISEIKKEREIGIFY